MSPTKRFLYIFFGVSLVVWIAANLVLGPPGLSSDYLDEYKDEHDRYLTIIKDEAYKRYMQRPELNEGTVPEEDLAFVQAYQARDAFQAEQRRRMIYGLFFDFFNAALVVILVVRFARKPLLNVVDEKIADLRAKIEEHREARSAAEARRAQAEAKIAQIPAEEEQIKAETQERLKRELEELEQANQHSLKLMEQELEDRKNKEWLSARHLVRCELVNEAVDRVAAQYAAKRSAEHEAVLTDKFMQDIEALS